MRRTPIENPWNAADAGNQTSHSAAARKTSHPNARKKRRPGNMKAFLTTKKHEKYENLPGWLLVSVFRGYILQQEI